MGSSGRDAWLQARVRGRVRVQRDIRARGRAGCRRREPLHTPCPRPRTRAIGLPYARPVPLAPAITEAVLEKLGLPDRPQPDRDGLDTLYLAWCRAVPFDNLVKRNHLAGGSVPPFPYRGPQLFLGGLVGSRTRGPPCAGAGGP